MQSKVEFAKFYLTARIEYARLHRSNAWWLYKIARISQPPVAFPPQRL
jgi:hypothetical protein